MFKFLRNLNPFARSRGVATEKRSGWNLFSGAFLSYFNIGETINQADALGISGVWRAVSILGETIASLPLHIFEEKENGDKQKAKAHPLYFILHSQPHQLYSKFNFLEALVMNFALNGNAYALIIRNEALQPEGLLLLESHEVTTYADKFKNQLYYKVANIDGIVPAYDMIHIAGMSANGFIGINKLYAHGKTLNGSKVLRDSAINFFANGSRPSSVLEYEKQLSDPAYNRLKTSFNEEYGGADNSGKTLILEHGVKYKAIGSSPKDAGLLENRRLDLEDISRIFGVPMHLLANLERATFNNIEHLTLQFVKLTITQLCERIEGELKRKLIIGKENLIKYTIEFDMEGLLRGDTKSRSEYYRTMFAIGAMSINEIRQKESMNRVEGGDTHYRPLNMEDILKIGEDETKEKKGEAQTDISNSKTQASNE